MGNLHTFAWKISQALVLIVGVSIASAAASGFLTPAARGPLSSDTLASCEDQAHWVCRTEQQFTHSALVKVDTQVKSVAGFLHCISISQDDAAPTAGTIVVYDSTAESGAPVFSWTLTAAVFTPIQICPDVVMTTGIYIGFTTTADVNVMVSYR